MNEPKKLIKAKQAGLKVTGINPVKNSKLNDFIASTEGTGKSIVKAYNELGVGKRPTDKKLAKRFDAARSRLKKKGII